MNAQEIRATVGLALIYALRMIGMFMILPVFALYAHGLPAPASDLQIGLAIGIYGLAQAALQIPIGIASDRWGRKPVIVIGLLIFAAGSFLAGATQEIHWIIAGRILQGLGAISSAVSALLADLTRDRVRSSAMAIMGAGMGLAFLGALVAGPVVAGHIGVDGIFQLTGVLALLGIPVVLRLVPPAPRPQHSNAGVWTVLRDPQLLRLDGGILLLHALLTGLFVAAPFAIVETLGLPSEAHWEVYLPVLLLSLLPVFPLMKWAENNQGTRRLFLAAIGVLGLAMPLLAVGHRQPLALLGALLLFFMAFNLLEGMLPSLISRRAPPGQRGAALGVYGSAQFLGPMLGGALLGGVKGHWGLSAAFAAAACLPLIWLSFATGLRAPAAPAPDSGAAAPHH
ncbi:MAG: MFS transporter [Stagnimonas sp.]|nr:MFS transporter [Stagnimonas sp.]